MKIVYQGNCFFSEIQHRIPPDVLIHIQNEEQLFQYLGKLDLLETPSLIILETCQETDFAIVGIIRSLPLINRVPIIILGNQPLTITKRRAAVPLKFQDYYAIPIPYEDLVKRIYFLIRFTSKDRQSYMMDKNNIRRYKFPFTKRLFDVSISVFLLTVFLIPSFLIAIAIKLTSPGPVIYKSKRVGRGYHIFDFYKFRTMRQDADKSLADLKPYNQYVSDGSNKEATFIKIQNDPRVTKIGRLLRKTSIDELPQLLNVIKGDMSLVGNRPLPLYEAEMLTSDQWAERFLGPAGLTGLWQIRKDRENGMSEKERKELDNYYARHFSFWLDFKIIVKTIPALFQKTDV
ncbi:sugar transferase [Olivibacter sitiensis]|uniref:sugar transferase n=1 Tax=Olivibacter sitiensis TaxID=376470 RepID=UPI0003F878E7|nr:sugar transferase [Olivibacter sitiensis]